MAAPSRTSQHAQPVVSKALRAIPHSIEAEQALLGAIMLKPESMHDISVTVYPESFYADKHREIFNAILDIFTKGNPIDLLSVSHKLKDRNQLDRVGGASYLTELIETVPAAGNAQYYAEVVQDKAVLRGLIRAADDIAELGFSNPESIDEALDTAEKKIYQVTQTPTAQKFTPIKNSLGEAWERLDRLHNAKDEIRGVQTGFTALDNLLAGLQKSDLILLAARPSVGKTSFALDIARNAACIYKTPVGFFSLEMSGQQLVDRMLAAEAKVDAWKLRTGKLSTDDEFTLVQEAMGRLAEAPIHIDDQPGNSILKMRSAARRLKHEQGLGLIVVDYLQLMMPANNRAYDSMVQQVTEISRALKIMARELDVPVLALSQLSRAVEQRGGKPRLSDLRDSGCLAGDTLLIRTDTGERVPIKDLVGKENVPLLSLDAEYRLRPVIASRIFPSGRKRVFALATRSGRTIKASGNHKFLTLAGWQRLDALQESDRIALPRRVSPDSTSSILTREEIVLLAHLVGDGCVLPRQPIHYTSADDANCKAVEDAAATFFGITPRRIRQKNWWHVYLPSPYRLTHGRRHPITNWYKRLGLEPVRSYEKHVPAALFAARQEDIRLFLHHLWATDGNISWKRLPGRKPAASIYYATTSGRLAEDVQHLLLRLGIWSTKRSVHKEGYRPCYHVHIQSAPVQLDFLKQVGSFGSRGAIVADLIKALEEIAPIPNTDTVPPEIWDLLVKSEKDAAGISWRDLAKTMGTAYNGTALFASGVSRTRLATVAKAVSSETLLHLAESDVYWDEVVSVEPLGIEEVYDATVPGTHNFIADDFIVHNSLEQDADVVMFIHRDDKTNKESDRPNIAEILVEKHRNGPTGVVELYFDAKRTTFLSLETKRGGEESFAGAPQDDDF